MRRFSSGWGLDRALAARRGFAGRGVPQFVLWVGVASLLGGCEMESTTRTDVAVTREQAEKALLRTLPASSRNVFYLFHAGSTQDLEFFLRLEVDAEDIDGAVAGLMAENDRVMKRTFAYTRSALSRGEPSSTSEQFLPVAWWEPDAIRHGYYMDSSESFSLRIWVDEDASRIFVYQND